VVGAAALLLSSGAAPYTASGNALAAARIADATAVVEHKLYWASAASEAEAHYLTAILNSATLTERVQPLQARGAFGPRDFDLYVFYVPIPLYDADEQLHALLAELGATAEQVAAGLELPEGLGFQRARALVRAALREHGVAGRIEAAVAELVPSA
jgi:hypothetical protein